MSRLDDEGKCFLLRVHEMALGEIHMFPAIQIEDFASQCFGQVKAKVGDSQLFPRDIDFSTRRGCPSTWLCAAKLAELHG